MVKTVTRRYYSYRRAYQVRSDSSVNVRLDYLIFANLWCFSGARVDEDYGD